MTPSRDYIFDRVLTLVAAGFDVPSQAIMARDRRYDVGMARHTIMYLLRGLGYSNVATGCFLRRNAAAVQWGVDRIRDMAPNDPRRKLVAKLSEQVGQLSLLTFPDCVKSTVVIRPVRGASRTPVEAYIERITAIGDGVQLKVAGQKPFWACQRDWVILDRLT